MKSWPRRRWGFRDAVVFSGGGNAGAAQVGMARALLEHGVEPDLFLGCSVGALNATFLASWPNLEQVGRLEKIWRQIGTSNVFGGTRRTIATHLVRGDSHIFEPGPLRRLIQTSLDVEDLAETAIPVQVVTTNLESGEPTWWACGDAVEILTASACLPGIFPPVRLDDELHVDGGVLCPVPTGRAITLGAQRIWVLDVCGSKPPPVKDKMTALDVLLNSFALARRAIQAPPAAPGQEVVEISVDVPPGLDVRDFSRTGELIELGYHQAQSVLSEAAIVSV